MIREGARRLAWPMPGVSVMRRVARVETLAVAARRRSPEWLRRLRIYVSPTTSSRFISCLPDL
jgi:hypothetical protein